MDIDSSRSELSDSEFIAHFDNCSIDPATFTHEAHLRLAWIHINTFGISQAKINIQRQLESFVRFAGAVDKYNKTLTIVGVEAVYHFMRQSKSRNFKDFMIEFPQLKHNFKALVNSHYSFNIFHSIKAKSAYLEPDVVGFE